MAEGNVRGDDHGVVACSAGHDAAEGWPAREAAAVEELRSSAGPWGRRMFEMEMQLYESFTPRLAAMVFAVSNREASGGGANAGHWRGGRRAML